MGKYAKNSGGWDLTGNNKAVKKDATEYNMNHTDRGAALIFYNENFHPRLNLNLSPRDGTIEKKMLDDTFKKLGFDVERHDNLLYKDVQERTKEMSEKDHSKNDCLVVVVVSNACEDSKKVFAYDESYEPETLCKFFTAEKCETLAGKPKIFLIVAPRGIKLNHGYIYGGKSRTQTDSASNNWSDTEYKIPTDADFLVVYSTMQGFRSMNKTEKEGGTSWFIQAFCDVMKEENLEEKDLLSLMTLVNHKIAVDFETNTKDNPYTDGKKQMPFITSTLTREVYFRSKAPWLSLGKIVLK